MFLFIYSWLDIGRGSQKLAIEDETAFNFVLHCFAFECSFSVLVLTISTVPGLE